MKTNNRDIFQITEVDRTVFKRSSTKETLEIQNYHLHSAERVVQLYVDYSWFQTRKCIGVTIHRLSTPLMTPWTTDHHTMHSNPREEPRIALSTPLMMTPWTTDHHAMHSNPREEPSQPEQPKGETSQERSNYIHLTLMFRAMSTVKWK